MRESTEACDKLKEQVSALHAKLREQEEQRAVADFTAVAEAQQRDQQIEKLQPQLEAARAVAFSEALALRSLTREKEEHTIGLQCELAVAPLRATPREHGRKGWFLLHSHPRAFASQVVLAFQDACLRFLRGDTPGMEVVLAIYDQ